MPKSTKAAKESATAPTGGAQPSTLPGQLAEYWPDFQVGAPKAVHEVRKLTRRAGAEAGVSDLSKRVRREWRDLRRAAAPIRDHDAAGEHLRAALREMNAKPAALTRFEDAWAARRAALLAAHPLPAQMPGSYGLPADWQKRAAKALNTDRKALLKQGKALMKAADTDDSEAWHDWRKLMKRYRYTVELCTGHLGGKAPREVRDMLEHLGRLQDAEVLLELLETEHQHFGKAQLKALQEREAQARIDARTAARALWPQLKAHLKGEEAQPQPTERAPDTQAGATQEVPEQHAPEQATAPAKAPTSKAAVKAGAPAEAADEATTASHAPTQDKAPAQNKVPAKKAAAKKVPAKAPAGPSAAKPNARSKAGANTSKPAASAAKKPAASRRKRGDSGSDS
ncbi:MAG: CHAD domain-containing protein [Deinococcus sp.]|nr:CHAD domain-containing protein [Deinococcus sp.]